MLKTYHHKDIIWYDFLQPSEEKFRAVAQEFNIDPYIASRFIRPSNRDKAFLSEKHLFLSISIPDLREDEYKKQQLNFIIDKTYIVSSSEFKNEGIEKFKRNLKDNKTLRYSREKGEDIALMFVGIIEKIYENMIYELQDLEDSIEDIERNIFQGNEKLMVIEISKINRKLIDFRKHIRGHGETWDIFNHISTSYFKNKESSEAIDSLSLSYQKAHDTAEQIKDTLWELRDTNNSLLNAKLSETSKTFTLIAFLTLPITLFASILSIPTKQEHFLGNHSYDFTIILIVSTVIFSIMLGISKWRRWW